MTLAEAKEVLMVFAFHGPTLARDWGAAYAAVARVFRLNGETPPTNGGNMDIRSASVYYLAELAKLEARDGFRERELLATLEGNNETG